MSWANAEIKSTHRLWESRPNKILTDKIVTWWYSEIIIDESQQTIQTDYVTDLIKKTGIVFNCFTKDRIWACPNKCPNRFSDVDNPGMFFSTGFCIFHWVTKIDYFSHV